MRLKCYYLLLFLLVLGACSNDQSEGEGGTEPTIMLSVPAISNLTCQSVTLVSKITGRNNFIKKGFCYSTSIKEPSVKDVTIEAKLVGDRMEAQIEGLNGQTTYYVRAFVLTDTEVIYSSSISFTTLNTSQDDELVNYQPPTYPDDYRSIAGWEQRSQWNLANVHDPSVVKADDGYYYMYQTDASYGNVHVGHGHFHCRRSQNLVDWEYVGAAMPETPPVWVKEELNTYRSTMGLQPIENPSYGYWAPVVRKVGNIYRLYYSIIVDNYIKTGKVNKTENFDGSWTERAFIGLMETSDPASNQWEDKGMVICSSSDKGMNDWTRPGLNDWEAYFHYNAIDPTLVVTPEGRHYLIYGSWHSGLASIELDPGTGKPLQVLPDPWEIADNSYGSLIATRTHGSRWQGSEGPEVIYNPETGYYYLFVAYGQVTRGYHTRVLRSKHPDRGYKDMRGIAGEVGQEALPVVTHPYQFDGSCGWAGFSHCAVFSDNNGGWYYASQARFPEEAGGNAPSAVMMGHVRTIRWTEGESNNDRNGWPVVMPERYGAVPQVAVGKEELAGIWELIQLKASSGFDGDTPIYSSVRLILSENGKVTAESELFGNTEWTYEVEKEVLVVNGVRIYLSREVDWESSPRRATIVGGGYQGNGDDIRTVWVKKIS